MREFVTAVAQEVQAEKDPITFVVKRTDAEGAVVEERELVAHYPTDGQVMMLMASMGRHTGMSDKIAGFIDFFVEVLDDDGHQYIVSRLLDREDEFGMSEVSDIMAYLMEEWGGRPTR